MKAIPCLLFVLFHCISLVAQNPTSVTVKAGSNIMDVLSVADVFQYPQFTYGNVFLKDGTSAAAKINYNTLLDEMHFIDPKGDTLALANEKLIRLITIDNDSFYYDQGYVRLIKIGSVAKLAEKQKWSTVETKKRGAYNTASSVSAIGSKSSYYDRRGLYKINVDEDVSLSKGAQYYFGDKSNHFVPVNKKNLLTLFPKEQRRIQQYLKENKVDFANRKDLENIIQFLGDI